MVNYEIQNTLLFLLILICLAHLSLSNTLNAQIETSQPENYKRIEIRIQQHDDFTTIGQLGIDLKCGAHLEEDHEHHEDVLTLEVSDTEYQALQSQNIKTTILIDDLSSFYAKRNVKDLPQALKELEKAKQESFNKNAEVGQDLGCGEEALPVPQNFNLGSMGGFITYQEMLDNLDQMYALYPNLITPKDKAHPTITTHEGRSVFYVKISDNPTVDEAETEVLYTGIHHAREPLSMMNQVHYMWYLLENYATDPTVKNIVDNTEMYFIPVVNPDGYVYNETIEPNGGGMWRKNRRNNGDGTYGVDPNRNYGYNWGYDNTGSSNNTNAGTYRGPFAWSEPCIQMVKAFVEDHNFINNFNNHAFGNVMFRPWSYSDLTTVDEELYDEVCEHMTWHNRYNYGRSAETIGYPVNGGATDWFYGEEGTKNKIFTLTPEIGSQAEGSFWPSPTYILPQCERHTRMSILLAATASNYGILNDLTPYGIGQNESLMLSVEHMSMTDGAFTITVTSNSPYVQNITTPTMTTGALTGANHEVVSTSITFAPNTPMGENIQFDVTLNNGLYDLHTMTINKAFSSPTIFEDMCENMNNWTSTSWNISNAENFEGGASLTDSPNNTSSNGTKSITMINSIDLSAIQNPVLEYYTKWHTYASFDYAQIEVSVDGGGWTELCTNHTKLGSVNNEQPDDVPLYDGLQKGWVREEIDLAPYVGSSDVKFRFQMIGNAAVTSLDGFYFDNVRIYREPIQHCIDGILNADETAVDCGGADCLPCPVCPNNLTIGDACDDGDDCTVGEVYDASCNCIGGTLLDANNDSFCDVLPVELVVSACLGGAYEMADNLMRDDLRTLNLIPLTDPYFGTTTLDATLLTSLTGNDAIVDWIVVELRDAASPATIVEEKAALIQRDGDIVDPISGATTLAFTTYIGNFHVAIRHRNHLGVMTENPISFTSVETVDFRQAQTATWGNDAVQQLNGKQLLWPANTDANQNVIFQGGNNDPNAIFFDILSNSNNTGTIINYIGTDYCEEDVNMDGRLIYQGVDNDTNLIFFTILTHPANVLNVPNFVIQEQLP